MSTYSDRQIDVYLAHVGLPFNIDTAREQIQRDALEFLTKLQRHHMARVPFESLSLHYSTHRTLSLDPEDLFSKIVKGSRGGYCMELNAFFATVLRSLDYSLFSVGARVCMGGVYGGWNHQLNIITIHGRRYVVDVGFGSNGPLQPNLLEDGREFPQVAPARGKLEYKALPIHTDASQRMWEYSTQADPTSPWQPMYAFAEVEFFPADFEVMNLSTMTSPRSFFVQAVMCMRTILDDRTGEPIGLLILLGNYVKRQLGGQSEIVENLETEAQRVEALRKWFQVEIGPGEQKAIQGLASELRPKKGNA